MGIMLGHDSLEEFARVDAFDGVTVKKFDRNEKEKIIFQDLRNKSDYVRFETYQPLKAYDSY
jgi:hypothetical protein